MTITKYEDFPSSKGIEVSIPEAYVICCKEHKNGYKPTLLGLSFHEFINRLVVAEEAAYLDNKSGAFIDCDTIAY